MVPTTITLQLDIESTLIKWVLSFSYLQCLWRYIPKCGGIYKVYLNSELQQVISGVPQGSVLGTRLTCS